MVRLSTTLPIRTGLAARSRSYTACRSARCFSTPSRIVYEGGKLRLRHYAPVEPAHSTPILFIYALTKRAFILDLAPGRSVVQSLAQQGFHVYLTDWIPPASSDSGRIALVLSALALVSLVGLAVYMFMNLGAFTVAAVVYRDTGTELIADYAGTPTAKARTGSEIFLTRWLPSGR